MTPRLQPAARLLTLALLVGTVFVAASPADEPATRQESQADDTALQPRVSGMTGDEVFSKLLEHNHLRDIQLQRYSALRTYEVTNDKGKVHAKAVVLVQYQAPSTKTFTTASEEGSKIIRRLVFKGLMESEAETAAGRSHRDSSIRPENYAFQLVGEEDVTGFHCFVVEATPKRHDKYLFEGTIWIDTQDFGIVQIAGHPAKNPSFWIKRVNFVRRYQKIEEFWLPLKDETVVDLKIHGRKILTIDHQNYAVNRAEQEAVRTPANTRGRRASAPLVPISAYSSQEGKSDQVPVEPGAHSE